MIADICKRNGNEKLKFTGDLSGNLCMHCYCASTACPGPYMKTKFKYIAKKVNALLDGLKNEWLDHKTPFKVKVAAKDLYIRAGAGTSYKKVKENGSYYIKPGVYTIIAVKEGGDYAWGKLKSSTEKKPKWIALDYTTFIG